MTYFLDIKFHQYGLVISSGKLHENVITFYGGKIQKNTILYSISIENSYFTHVRLSQKQAPDAHLKICFLGQA